MIFLHVRAVEPSKRTPLNQELTLYNEHLSRSEVGNSVIMNKVHLFVKDKIMASSLERFHCRYVMCIFTLNCSYGFYTQNVKN